MQHEIEDIEYAEYLFDRFYGIGSSENGGVTRLGYTEVEDEMHRVFRELGEEKGYGSYEGEAIASPPSEGKTDDGIFYRRISVACGDGYVYAVQSFLYDGIAGYVSYERYDLDEWSSSFEGAAKRLFDGIRVSEAGLLI